MIRFPLLFLLIAAAGCGPTAEQVVAKHSPAMLAFKTKLERISAQLPPPGGVSPQTAILAPPLVLAVGDPANNCESLMAPELAGEKSAFDLLLNNNLSTALYWAENPPSGGNPAFMEQTFSAALQARYLVVHRVDEAKLPKAVSGETFVGGDVPVEGFVFDLESEKLVAAYQFVARPADAVDYEVRKNESETERLEAGARSTVWTDARTKLAAKLAETTGGRVEIR